MLENKFNDFVTIVKKLRKECPWDKEQTNDSIKAATLEEAYEVVQAIDEKNFDELKKEIGDLFLHVIFHTQIAEELGHFNIEDVIDSISEKLIRRHPHVFGNKVVGNSEDVKSNWEAMKLSEGRKSVVDGLPEAMSSLLFANRLQEKVAKVGFDWKDKKDVWKKCEEELNELKEAEENSVPEFIEEEFGDLLFALVNYARFIKVNPEDALRKTNQKFMKRFRYIEKKLAEQNKNVLDSNLEEMDIYWNESKKK
ncbi:MAG: nucleoside triphosphate pyrophosphohydrolase [Chlorobiaceae bacterium]|nr:nucleoside triphosphate pyrophosphohydrolase [Chlorobiaceae bacterium]MBA4310020.1 nucleoside triphosphate pyrophosphohydrolase [Chlorobiaceae bacterium]